MVTAPRAQDGTVKYLFELDDGLRVESVYLPGRAPARLCAFRVNAARCQFCATAKMGLFRNLTAAEIVRQVATVERQARTRITNIVYMGMGEPLHNYDEVCEVRGGADGQGWFRGDSVEDHRIDGGDCARGRALGSRSYRQPSWRFCCMRPRTSGAAD